ncbi:hypothetical protein GCM10022223_23950 [Kineosporia mesophila]|uniref:Uncharacterized protein n=1 Tax=Kineosporia mesophila TaxID=566012 RepID=A0ABP6ZGT2_9ACTN|nr:hypothetical protein [Kineosporia mesophila]MCD5354229.1 hypothetical protein [Kineosporia mesophila]
MRYNPPPNWPAPPTDWTPPAGWRPDPTWPPPPEDWQLWLPDNPEASWLESLSDGEPPRPARAESEEFRAMGMREEIRSGRRAALIAFGLAFAAALIGAVTLVVALTSKDGGIVWIGGIIFGTLWMIRSIHAFFTAGGRPVSNGVWAAGMCGLFLAFLVGFWFYMMLVTPVVDAALNPAGPDPSATPGVDPATAIGQCWNMDASQYLLSGAVVEADCAFNHDFVGSSLVEAKDQCPEDFGVLKTNDERFLCLKPDRWDK